MVDLSGFGIEPQKTHELREKPGMSANILADYMAASEQGRRSILRGSKFRPKARLVQHSAARESISEWLSSGLGDTQPLNDRIEQLRGGLAGSDFANDVAEHNADYIERFLECPIALPPKADMVLPATSMPALDLDGFTLSFSPNLLLKRTNRRNVPKLGVAFFRYSKGKALSEVIACWQGAISLGYLTTKVKQGEGDVDPERELCITYDLWTGAGHTAPTNATYRFNEVRAACAGIVERWPKIPAPDGAVL